MHRPFLERRENFDETLFGRAEKDGLFFRNLFDRNFQQYNLLKKLCQCSDPVKKLKKLKLSYEAGKEGLSDAFRMMDQLIEFLLLIEKEQWEDVSEHLNHADTRELMMSALYSMQNVDKISKALEYPRIYYSLDAGAITFFALKDQIIADKIFHQTFWEWLGFSIRQFFWPEKTLEIPVDRLKGIHVRQVLEHYPEYWNGPVKKGSELRKQLRFENLQKLTENPASEIRHATSKAVLEDKKLRKLLEVEPKSQEAANARVNLLRDYGASILDKRKKSKMGGLVEVILNGSSEDKYVADDAALENFYFQQFLALIQTSDRKKTRNGHIALRNTIKGLWNNSKTAKESDVRIQLIKKKAMLRVLRLSPENTVLKNMPEEYYIELFSDPIIFKNFLENSSLQEAFSRKGFLSFSIESLRSKMFQWVLQRVRATRQGYGGTTEFNEKHLLAVSRLYNVPQDEILNHPIVCVELINVFLQSHDHLAAISFLLSSETFHKEKNIARLLQHAKPMQLVEWLSRSVGIRSDIKLKIAEIEARIVALEAEHKTLLINKRKRGRHKELTQKALEIKVLSDEKKKYDFFSEFFNISVRTIQEKDEIRAKLAVSEVSSEVLNQYEQELLNASSDPILRQQVWENPEHQAELAEKASLPYVLLFIRSSRCPEETVLNWGLAFVKLLDPNNSRLLDRDWDYLINNVPNFAAWMLYQLTHTIVFALDKDKIQSLLDYTVSGFDVLKILEKEHQAHAIDSPLRARLLKDPAILMRALRCNRKTLNRQEWANLIVRVCVLEKDSEIARQLLGWCEEEIINFADYTHLHMWLESGHTDDEDRKVGCLKKAFLSSQNFTEQLNKDHELKLLRKLLHSSSDVELPLLLKANSKGFDCVLNDEQLLERCEQLNNVEFNERFYVYLKEPNTTTHVISAQHDTLIQQLGLNILNNLGMCQDSSLHLRMLSLFISQVRSDPTKRQQVTVYLQSATFSRNMHLADSESLYHLFSETNDPRAVKSIFFQHPILGDSLMAKLWLSLDANKLASLMTQELESFDLGIQDVPRNCNSNSTKFTGLMIKTLLNHFPSEQYCGKLKELVKNAEFLKVLLSNVTLTQLNSLLSADKEISQVVVDYFKFQPEAFFAALKRSSKLKDLSHLRQLQQLFSTHAEITSLFVGHVREDRAKNCTTWFDSIVIDFVEQSSDHETVFEILGSIYRVAGGDFLLNFSVPLNDSKTRIFMFYHLCGGEAISTLYNDRIDLLRKFSERICVNLKVQDFLDQLERDDVAGYDLTFHDLISDDYRSGQVSDGSRSYSRTEAVLYTLYTFVRHLSLIYYKLMDPNDKLYHTIKIAASLNDLFARVIGAEDKFFKLSTSHCNAQQLARLIDADEGLSNQFNPFFDWFFSLETENRLLLKKLTRDPLAVEKLLSSQALLNLKNRDEAQFQKITAHFSKENSTDTIKALAEQRAKVHAGASASSPDSTTDASWLLQFRN
ncbi:MAG: hypothetical protein K2X50_09880 [Gammaproteobacteria bacterium]|nr:hypothetical protein [Gammaproteobacteria bacterium]